MTPPTPAPADDGVFYEITFAQLTLNAEQSDKLLRAQTDIREASLTEALLYVIDLGLKNFDPPSTEPAIF